MENLYPNIFSNLPWFCMVGMIVPILHMKKLKLREVK